MQKENDVALSNERFIILYQPIKINTMKTRSSQSFSFADGDFLPDTFCKPTRKKAGLKAGISTSVLLFSLLIFSGFLFQGCNLDDDSRPILPVQVLDLVLIADNMVSPVGLISPDDASGRLFVIDQTGKVWIINNTGTKLTDPFLDVSSKMVSLNTNYDERGLLGLAFHPDFSSNRRIFVYYTAPPNAGGPEPGETWDNISRISEFTVLSSDANLVDIASEKIILEVNQPQGNHEGGTIAFGPDGYLYISIGDGGESNDVAPGHVDDWYEVNEGGNGQDIEANLLGDILRIDIDGGNPYGIPSDNPFVNEVGLDEIYAYGFRNPFRFSFDMGGTNRLFVGDAGQSLWEEINIMERGGNYGWNVKEGTHCFDASNYLNILDFCPDVDIYGNELIDPVIEMKNTANPDGGNSVTIIGGYVYRGINIPGIVGLYIFGSFSRDFQPTGELFIANPTGPGLWSFMEIDLKSTPGNIGHFLKGFGQDNNGEVYVAASINIGPTGSTGKIFKLALVDAN